MKTVIITGANAGLGFETAKRIAANPNYHLILACRNLTKAQAAKEAITKETGNDSIETQLLDTSSLSSVRAFAQRIVASGQTIDVLINNAGIPSMGATGMTADGYELVFGTNYLGHFLLVQLLLPVMAEKGRIYNVTSDMHNPPGGIDWPGVGALAHPETDDSKKYAYSKLCMIYMTHQLAAQLKEEGSTLTINSFNPGFMADTNFSNGTAKAREEQVKASMPDRYSTLAESSEALASLAISPEFETVSGQYFDRSTKAAKSSELSYNDDNAAELWEASLQYCDLL